MKTRFLFLLISIFYFFSLSLSSGQSQILDQYIEVGLRNNLGLEKQKLRYAQSLQSLKEAKGLFLPNISLEAAYTQAGGGRAFEFPLGDLVNPIHQTLNDLISENAFPANLNNVEEPFLPNNFQETKLRLVQPVFSPAIHFNREIKKDLTALKDMERRTYQRDLVRDIRKGYFQYLQAVEAIKIYDGTEKLLLELLSINEKLVSYDKALKDVIFRTRYEISELRRQKQFAIRDQQLAEAFFNSLLNRPLDQEVKVDSTLIRNLKGHSNLNSWPEEALADRPELQKIVLAQSINEKTFKQRSAEKLPTVNFVLDVGFQGFGYELGAEQAFWLANVSLKWNIFQGHQRRARMEQTKIESRILHQQAQELRQQVRWQVLQAKAELMASISAIEASQASIMSAQENYRMLKQRYQQAQVLFIEVLDARTKLTQAKLTLNLAHFDFLGRQADLNWALGR